MSGGRALIDDDLWRGTGVRSVEHWLSWKAGLSWQRAHQIAEVAQRSAELPVTHQTFTNGELSFEQVPALTTTATIHDDADLASFAKAATVSQIRRTVSRYRFAEDPTVEAPHPGTSATGDGDTADTASTNEGGRVGVRASASSGVGERRREQVREAVAAGSMTRLSDGIRYLLRVDAPHDQGALIEQALSQARDALFHAGVAHVTWLDALLEVCNRSLSTATSTGRRDKYRAYVHLDIHGSWLNNGPSLPRALSDKILCDTSVAPAWEAHGRPVSVGRSQRIVPDRTRRLVEDRDRICVVPGCGTRHHLEVHHIVHWSDGGPTDTDNLALLCCADHDAHHRGEFTNAGNADTPNGLIFTDRNGNLMDPVRVAVPPTTPPPSPPPGHAYRHPYGERIDTSCTSFSPTTAARSPSPDRDTGPPSLVWT
jgi:hypothetical protein